MIGEEFKTIEVSKLLQERKILLTTALYPVVEKNKARLRIALSATHTETEIAYLIDQLNDIVRA